MAEKKSKPAAKQPRDLQNKESLSKVQMASVVGGVASQKKNIEALVG